MTTTAQQPGSYSAPRLGLDRVLRRVASPLRKGDLRLAARTTAVEAANYATAKLWPLLPRRVRCSCCGHTAPAFVHLLNELRIAWNSACPRCDSRSRHRGLAVLLPRLLRDLDRPRVLHLAPEAVLRRILEAHPGVTYESADLFLEDVTHAQQNLERLTLPDQTYSMVVCNHVLEHVQRDDLAVKELARVLAPDGIAVITIPGDFTRRATVRFRDNSLNGHWRDYGLDVVELLETAFSTVIPYDLHTLDSDVDGLSHAIRAHDLAFLCRGPRGRA